jgi:hypothetical protein
MVLSSLSENTMKIEVGKLYCNKTQRYLVPALNFYGSTLKTKFNLVFKLGFGIHDSLMDGSHLEGQKNIYIMIDKLVRPEMFNNFMDWIKHQEYYVTDYDCESPDETYRRKHMLVIAFPPSMEDSYMKFLEGKYSKMYTKNEVRDLFSEEHKKPAREILLRHPNAKHQLKAMVRETFGTWLEDRDLVCDSWEYDLPPTKSEEFFNYKREVL